MATTFAVPDGRVAMAATTYTGTGATLAVSNAVNSVGMQPDLVWMKARVAGSNNLVDSVRGVNKILFSDATTAETTYTDNLTSFNAGGFSVGASASSNVNINGNTYVGWQWKAGDTTVTNGVGTISSQVRANTTAGFSVVTYTGTGANATVGHGLGVAPSFIIAKNRSGANSWRIYHSGLTSAAYILYLDLPDAQLIDATTWNSTAPAATVFSIGTSAAVNTVSNNYVAYCWSAVPGYSGFGRYTGNGSADGPFVYLGFRPRWILIKSISAITNWRILDTSRDVVNVESLELFPNLSNAEGTGVSLDGLSNGFKIRTAGSAYNTSADTYIYAAYAENPLKYANAR